MQEEKKLDRRVIKTKKAIRNAFAKLISEKDINKVTIKDSGYGGHKPKDVLQLLQRRV